MTVDLQILRGHNQGTPSAVAYASPARGLEGSAKAAQKFAALFLRDYDAVRNRGTSFTSALRAGRIRTDAAVQTNFTAAVVKIVGQLGDQSSLPSSEQISRADLIDHSLFSDRLTLIVKITTPAGTVEFPLPIERLP